ncbi:MAG: hypothetical protein Q8N18_04530 [Opitutaceae bacterium]|nr:hypothetical protein [Opitutaceae bacterium]
MGSQSSALNSRLRRAPRRGRVLRSAPREAGFALLIVVTLLAFIVLLLVGLAAYTRVETSIAGNTQRQAQARENALLALNVALGQLQKHAGPDKRVTATAEALPNRPGTTRYTGVWASDPADDPDGDPLTPLTWLVSGNELRDAQGLPLPLAIAPDSAVTPINSVALVSTNTSRTANDVLARLLPITATGVPGAATGTTSTIGRYAWWVGDQGVKAPVAIPDTTAAITYPPYDTADARARIRQQISLGAGAADATTGAPVFEPQDSNNASLVADSNRNPKITTVNQLAFLRSPANAQLGLTRTQQNFHAWSPNNFSVLADTRNGGLRQDLSLKPELLGAAFAAWANYSTYTESTSTPAAGPAILPSYDADPLRRRLVMTPHQIDGNASHQIAPILSYLLLTFNVRTQSPSGTASPLEARARWMLSLWNPYTAALVPENLRVEISGLPTSVQVVNEETARAGNVGAPFSLRTAFGNPLNVSLPWDAGTIPSDAPAEDRQSWLPGRVYTWRSEENTDKTASLPAAGFTSAFYSRTLSQAGAGVQRAIPTVSVIPNDTCHLKVGGASQLTVRVYAVRESGDVLIGRFTSPEFEDNFITAPQRIGDNGYQFSYVFRLAESIDTPATPAAWLTTDGRDFRRRSPPAEIFVVESAGNNPAAYENYSTISRPARLLDRANNSYTFNEDVPLFELPRAPLLSLGTLQHLRILGRRPFMIGNSWGVSETLNNLRLGELFDRFYFSGLVAGVTPTTNALGDLVLPSLLQRPLRNADGTKPGVDDLRGATDARSAKHFLQGGGFNLNSQNVAAWAAVLRGVRFAAPKSFSYLAANEGTGTAADSALSSVQSTDARFFRFSQSAQETYKAEPGNSAVGDDTGVTPPNTHLFRQGMRTLTAAQVAALAGKIAELVRVKQAAADGAGGPFRSLEEFLSPSVLYAGTDGAGNLSPRSLLEAAIADAGVNTEVTEFSSQFLTQADIMTALAPVLFPRSDTFVIRTYGEAVNPATNATEGRAWCEALVQRIPDYMDASAATGDPAETLPANLNPLNQQLGRRFKVVSFRWLTRSDI